MSNLSKTVELFPQTEVWNDSCSCAELTYSLETNCASGATTNPVIVGNVLKKELKDWEPTIEKLVAENPSASEDDIAWWVIETLGSTASKLLMPQFEATNGQKGRISFQTNSKFYNSKERIVEHAAHLAALVPNSQIKAPTSKAGVEAFEELTYQGVSINATVSFTVAQAVAVAEAVERGLARREAEGKDTSSMHPVCTIMAGRVDDYLKGWIKNKDLLISSDALELAGVAVVKNAYKIYKEKGYRTKLLVAAFRNNHHFEDFIGGDLILTIPCGWQKKYNSLNCEIKNNMDTPVDEKIMNELLTLDEFKKAYLPDGLKPEEFEHYGAFLATMNQFLDGYDSLVKLIRGYMVK